MTMTTDGLFRFPNVGDTAFTPNGVEGKVIARAATRVVLEHADGTTSNMRPERVTATRVPLEDISGNPVATHVTVPAGTVARKTEQTASSDHDVTLDAGTYPIKWETDVSYRDGRTFAKYGWASIPATAHEHWSSTAEFGGVALAGEQRGGEREHYSFHVYSYQANGQAEFYGYGLHYGV
jgi:hypothetical protein